MSAGKPPSRDWRAQPPVQSLYSREWRHRRSERPERFSRRFKLRVVGACLIALVALIVILLAPAASGVAPMQILTFGIGAYGGRANPQGNMPVNPYGEQDARAFQVLNDNAAAQFLPVRNEDNALSGAQFLSFLQTEADSPELAGKSLLVFCTLHGIVQPSGDVELFAIDATPESPGSSSAAMVRFKDLVARLQESRARRVLLILDAARLGANWKLGVLNNDVAAQLAADWPPQSSNANPSTSNEAAKVTILLSAGVGQQSWIAENESALVRFLIEGLAGAADGWDDGKSPKDSGTRDRRISLHELFAFVRQRVEDWTRQHCGVIQTVQMLGNVANYDLAIVSPTIKKDQKPASPKPTDVKPDAVKGQATKTTQATATNEKSGQSSGSESEPDTKTSKTESASTNETPTQTASIKNEGAGASDLKASVRLEELRKARDEWQESGRQGRHAVCRQMPLTWRRFESQLALADALQRGGLDELTAQAVLKADIAYKKLQTASAALAGLELNVSDTQRQSLHDFGFLIETNPSPQVLAQAGTYLMGILKETAVPAAPDSAQPSGAAKNSPEPEPTVIQVWLRQELRRDTGPENWGRLRQIVDRLHNSGRLPSTAECQFVRNLLTTESASSRFGDGDVVQRIFGLRDRYQRLAVRSPESLPEIHETVQSGMRSLNAAERWLLATDTRRSEVRDWLDKSDESATQAESSSQRYLDAVGIWSDLLAELPALAEWVATRASDDESRNDQWTRLRDLSRQWSERERDGRWNVESFRNSWPDKPARLTDLERMLLSLFVNTQRLKVMLLKNDDDPTRRTSDELSKLANQCIADRKDFREEIRRAMPRLGTADRPSPSAWREADRLLVQSWLPGDERRKLSDLRRLEPRGNPLPDHSAESGSFWQGFWAVATISLFATDPEITAGLWKDWERLADLSQPVSAAANPRNNAEWESLRKRRAELGWAIRQQFNALQNRAQSAKNTDSLPMWHMQAATIDPTQVPETDPDVRIRDERQQEFVDWLALFIADWRSRAMSSPNSDSVSYAAVAERAEALVRELGGSILRRPPSPQIRLVDETRSSFDADRLARLNLSVASIAETKSQLKVLMTGARMRLVEGSNLNSLSRTVVRPLPADGQLQLTLKLDDDVDTAQTLLVVLTEADGYPVDFRQILLYPPFDPTQWRIEFVEATTNTVLEHVPLSESSGVKIFLPPMAGMSLRADLIRPLKDSTASAKITIYRLTDSSRVPLVEDLNLKLEAGKARTPILCDFPAPDKDKKKETEAPKDKAASVPLADLARGWLFQISPESQKSLEYQVRPTFWSAAKFLREPQPIIKGDRLTMELERRPASKEDVLLPEKIQVDLNLPDSLQNVATGYTLGGPVAVGQKLTLSFGLPKNWSDLARDRNWILALDVAGLPHAHRWRIEPTGNVTPVPGQPPQLEIRLLHPPADPKAPPRLEPVIRKGKEPLHLRFLVDATELDRTEERGDWTLSYTVVRQTESGSEPTPLQNSWRLFSSVQRHVLLDSIQAGVWNLRTLAENYDREEPVTEIRGLSGRFQVHAVLTRAAQPSLPLATAKLLFGIDDDAPPGIDVKGLTTDPRPVDKDLPFRILATDLESGIQRVVYGFDKNGDKQLQEEDEALEEHSFKGLEDPNVDWPVIISKANLPTLEKDVETHNLIVQARNSLGVVGTRMVPITFRKPTKVTTGTLVVNLNTSRGGESTIQLTGPKSPHAVTKEKSWTFPDLPEGQYKITVKVSYAVIGRREEGEVTADVTAGKTKPVDVPLSTAK